MMRFILLVVSLILFSIGANNSAAFSYIYNDSNQLVYIGGDAIEYKRKTIGKVGRKSLYMMKKLYLINVQRETAEAIFEADSIISFYEISSHGYIAISTSSYELTICNGNGDKIKVIKNVPVLTGRKLFSWSADGKKIAYVTGDSANEDRVPFYPNGVWIYDIEKDETKKINIKGVKINWSKHDGRIYIQEDFNETTKVSVYDPSSGKLSKSDKKGILFTDDGKYYFVSDLQKGLEYKVRKHFIYDNATNEPIYEFKREPLEWPGWGTFIRKSHQMLMWDFKGRYQTFDIDVMKVMKKSKSGLIGWNKDMTKVVVYEGGDKIHIDELLTGKRLKSIEIPK